MSIGRLKSLIIGVLIVINLFFLADILLNNFRSGTEESRTLESLRVVMASSGIEFSEDAVSDVTALGTFATSQDMYSEAVIARAILGDCEPVPAESGQHYLGARGTAFFNTRGEFIIELTDPYSPPGSSAERAAKKLLRSMDISVGKLTSKTFGQTEEVTTFCTWRGSRIFNCTVTFRFSGGSLLRVEGCRPSGVYESGVRGDITFSTAMLSFLRYEKEQGFGSTVIISVEAGYRMNVAAFGEGTLNPGWLITTDTDVFFADALTGEVLQNNV